MSFPNLMFKSCPHCKGTTWEPRPVCPTCDWPRCHLDETPVPENMGGFPAPKATVEPPRPPDPLQPTPAMPVAAPIAEPKLPEVNLDSVHFARLTTITLADDPEEPADGGSVQERPEG